MYADKPQTLTTETKYGQLSSCLTVVIIYFTQILNINICGVCFGAGLVSFVPLRFPYRERGGEREVTKALHAGKTRVAEDQRGTSTFLRYSLF